MNADEKEVERLFAGQWEQVREENLDQFLDAIGIDSNMKEAILKLSPTLTVAVVADKDNEYVVDITLDGGSMKQNTVCKLGKQHKVQGVIEGTSLTEFKDGKLISDFKPDDKTKKDQQIAREIVNGELKQTLQCDGKIGTRYFKKKA